MKTFGSLLYIIISPIYFLIILLKSFLLLIVGKDKLGRAIMLLLFLLPLILVRLFVHLDFSIQLFLSILGYIICLVIIIAIANADKNLERRGIGGILLAILWGTMIGIWF